jgi:hypothetical protein
MDDVLGFESIDGDTEHLSSHEIGNIDVLDDWGRHCGYGMSVLRVEGDHNSIKCNCMVLEMITWYMLAPLVY